MDNRIAAGGIELLADSSKVKKIGFATLTVFENGESRHRSISIETSVPFDHVMWTNSDQPSPIEMNDLRLVNRALDTNRCYLANASLSRQHPPKGGNDLYKCFSGDLYQEK